MSYAKDIRKMHEYYGIAYDGKPRDLIGDQLDLRLRLIAEEHQEYLEAVFNQDREGVLDALIDLCVVAIGTADLMGLDFHEGWNRVLASNMTKKVATKPEQSKRGKIGDLYKDDDFVPVNLKDLVE